MAGVLCYIFVTVKEVRMETAFSIACALTVFSFSAWCLWVLSHKHPARLIKLRREWAVRETRSDTRDI